MMNGIYNMFNGVHRGAIVPRVMANTTRCGWRGRNRMGLVMNLHEIGGALSDLIKASKLPEAEDFRDKEPLSVDIIRRLMNGYAYVNDMLREGVDLFNYGSSGHWLELNHLVLCGSTPERREQFRVHIEQTERRFYDDSIGGIGERIEWLLRNRTSTPEALAAGIFLQITSSPQLFIEGNRRTATLVASYALVSHGLPPIVVTDHSYHSFFALTDGCKRIDRKRWDNALLLRRETSRIEQFIRANANRNFLIHEDD